VARAATVSVAPPTDVVGCLACDLTSGRRDLPGGRIHATASWVVEHCVGPLGLGTLIVKPARHVLRVAELTADESLELGPLLQLTCAAITTVVRPDQVYVTLWSHPHGRPAHIHFVLQPVSSEQVDRFHATGPTLQAAMFAAPTMPADADITTIADQIRAAFAAAHRAPPKGSQVS
jgi:diadenosine tetraphosphate (Ap4A) HIT family hydrolase